MPVINLPLHRRRFLLGSLTAAASSLAGCAPGPMARLAGPGTRYTDRPAVMAIGDSLYQGVRSLSFTSGLAPFSPPAQAARALNRPMTVPDPPVPLLFDLEHELRQGAGVRLLATVREASLDNMRFWTGGSAWSRHEAFDNVSIGGAEIASLYTDCDADYWSQVQTYHKQIRADPLPDPGATAKLWYALNVCFTLNPLRREEQARKTQIDQVRDRRPHLLLVNIGSNEGLYRAGFLGAFGEDTFASVAAIPRKMEPLADELARLPPEVETIVFNSLIQPRTASNLMPAEEAVWKYPGDDYFAAYGPWLIDPAQHVPGSVVKRFDDTVQEVNREVAALLRRRLGSRLRYVDLYAASSRLDGKHYQDRFMPVRAPDGFAHELRNRPFIHHVFDGRRFDGGLTGLDNMHPTVPGYAAIADAVLAAVGVSARTDKDAAFREDTLLNSPPLFTPIAQDELRQLGALGVFRKLTQETSA